MADNPESHALRCHHRRAPLDVVVLVSGGPAHLHVVDARTAGTFRRDFGCADAWASIASFFFPGSDWGAITPGFLCRVLGSLLRMRWWHHRKSRDGFLGALALGLGLFSKIDFVVILLGCAIAVGVRDVSGLAQ